MKYKEWKTVGRNNSKFSHFKSQKQREINLSFTTAILNGDAQLTKNYEIYANGRIHITNQLIALKGEHSPIYRFGNQFEIPEYFSQCQWYGNGPGESYIDRKNGVMVGKYNSSIDNMHTNYADLKKMETEQTLDGLSSAMEKAAVFNLSLINFLILAQVILHKKT